MKGDSASAAEEGGEDKRFTHVKADPRFRKAGKTKRKVKIDNRFQHMFTDPSFNSVDFVDSRGRKEKVVSKENLERFYEVEKGESESEKEEEVEEEEEEIDDEEEEDSSDGESSEGEEEEPAMFDAWDEVNTCVETISESTPRLSICNLNWDRVTATDIFVMCQSSLPVGGSVRQVHVYPSQFGKEQMAKERERGPEIDREEEGEREEKSEYSNEALRKYQVERLKYYYAIVTCDSTTTADQLYKELDGVEYQLSSSILDLRYVPDDIEFDDDPPSSTCVSMPDMTSYKPPQFTTTALQNSSVKLTWDETDQNRLHLTTKKFTEKDLENVDFSTLIASSESESEGEEGEGPSLEKYKALLADEDGDAGDGDVDQEMEITWTTGLEDNQEVLDEAQKNENRQEEATLYQPDETDDFFATDTVIEKPEKKKKKKKRKGGEEISKEASELALLMEENKDDKKHFNMKKIVKTSGKSEDDTFQVDLDDDRFSAFKSSHLYAIDPSAPEYKSTAQTERLRAAQAAALSEAGERRKEGGGTGNSVLDKIKSRSAAFEKKKQGSKLYKTKDKLSKEQTAEISVPSEETKVKKKKKKVSVAIEEVEVVEKKKKKRKTEEASTGDVVKKKKKKKLET